MIGCHRYFAWLFSEHRRVVLILLLTFFVVGIPVIADDNSDDSEDDELVNYLSDFEAVVRTNKGRFTLTFLPDYAPAHVLNFIALAKTGFYEGLTFHRYVENFVVQGGDVLGNGTGGPGYTIPAEISEDELHIKGAVGMARTGDDVNPERRSSGSQFYICLEDVHRLDRRYTVWANVSKGMDVVLKLRAGDVIERITIRKIGDAFEDDVVATLEELERKATDPITGLKYIDLKAVAKTPKGIFEFGFYYNAAPEHVIKFVELAHKGFYDGITISNYESGKIVEVGDESATGDLPSDYLIPFEFHPDYKHIRGAIGMPLDSIDLEDDRHSNSRRFYICLDEIPELNGERTIWGYISRGLDVVGELRAGDKIETIRIVLSAEPRHGG